ncbi:integrase family protein [Noviherbaspirillum sp. UKPF54]|uniref:tyrosine-type recombinase/integrase n=1 Tax=Noviherbaspirillum sp. UKPF54 TaxID=2601898 RepID=UPI0011B1258E|nr:integrase family protein [Noviherbaspirillum sp. UKPF54]QDZ29063.1 DUF4102 domain-containing protein [Noviherbaspirillum sp. UKPF54]
MSVKNARFVELHSGMKRRDKQAWIHKILCPICSQKMPIVTLSDALIQRLTSSDRRILRDRVLSGFCLRVNKRTKTFIIATSANGEQVRITLGRWPLLTADEARAKAAELLRDCRNGKIPAKSPALKLPTLRDLLPMYAAAKGIKPSSLARYESLLKVHFATWQDLSISEMDTPAFSRHCHEFAQTRGAAVVETGRGLIGAVIKYANAVHGLTLESPFSQLAAAGLMPEKAQPRMRKLQEDDLPQWYLAVQRLPEKQRDLLILLALTGLRRNEGGCIRKKDLDFESGVMHIPETKTGHPHSLPITPILREILNHHASGLEGDQMLFAGVSMEHLAEMAMRAGAPKFMLHDLRKLLATIGERLGFSDAILRRILNHKAKRSDTLHRHYVSVSVKDIQKPLEEIQLMLLCTMQGKK